MAHVKAPERLNIKGVIQSKTFKTYPTHPKRCTFRLKEITFQDATVSDTDKSTLATELEKINFVYWAEMKHYLPVLRYTVQLFEAKQNHFRGEMQYNVDKDNLVLTEKKVKNHVTATTKANENGIKNYHTNVDVAIKTLFKLEDPNILRRMEKRVHRVNHPNLAHVMTAYNIPSLTDSLSKENQKLLARFGEDGDHLSNYVLLHRYGITTPESDSSGKTAELVLLVFTNPYKVLEPANYELFREYKGLSFDRMERIAMEIYGVQIGKVAEIIIARYAAALISVLIEYEIQTGSTIVTWRKGIELVAKKINQAESIVEDTFRKYPKPIYFNMRLNQIDEDQNEDQITFQRPETRRKEEFIRNWVTESSAQRCEQINEKLLEQVLTNTYGDFTRDSKQLEAIRLAITSRVTLISGPPGSGKTTFVVRSIVRYMEATFQDASVYYQSQQKLREQNDTNNVMNNLTEFIKNMYRKYFVIGELDPETVRDTEFDAVFEEAVDRLRYRGEKRGPVTSPMPIQNLKRICQLKMNEFKQKTYRLFASTDLCGVKMMAPSGVASRRLKDACDGHETHTCCSLLAQLEEDAKKKPSLRDIFPFRMMIIDESSMIDMETLIQIIKMAEINDCQILLIGDHHQLPPIGLGQVFRDLIENSVLQRIVLTNIYRQGAGSKIAQLSKNLVANNVSVNDFTINYLFEDTSFHTFVPQLMCVDEEIVKIEYELAFTRVNEFIGSLYEFLLFEKHYQVSQVQILTPYKDKIGGRADLNVVIQNRVAEKRKILNGGRDINQPHPKFYAMDPVIHRKNNKMLDICNGDQGTVLPVLDPEQYQAQNMVPVQYTHQTLKYMKSKSSTNPPIHELELSYALTAHLAQVSHKSQLPLYTLISMFDDRAHSTNVSSLSCRDFVRISPPSSCSIHWSHVHRRSYSS